MDIWTFVLLCVGLILLVVGAEGLVRGASQLAVTVGVSPLVVGLTVVAYGTSAPELAVTAQASWTGQTSLAIGNVVGSNICNVLLILGLSALVAPLAVDQQLVRWDVPLMIGVSLLLWVMAADGQLTRMECGLLASGAVAYTVLAVYWSRRETAKVQQEYAEGLDGDLVPQHGLAAIAIQVLLIVGGLGLLVLGSRWLVSGAVALATAMGVSKTVIGLTIVAVGTSLPEIATSVMASIRGQRDIAVGNVVGSNLFNILSVLGFAGLFAPQALEVPASVLRFDMPIMIAVAVACLPVFFTGYEIARWEGAVFLAYYVAYTSFLVMAAREHVALPVFSTVMLWFAIPLTALTLIVLTMRALYITGPPAAR